MEVNDTFALGGGGGGGGDGGVPRANTVFRIDQQMDSIRWLLLCSCCTLLSTRSDADWYRGRTPIASQLHVNQGFGQKQHARGTR
jgi:hypothetical protein